MLAQMEMSAIRCVRRPAAQVPDEFQEQWDLLRRRLTLHPHASDHHIADCCQAYEEATGTLTGCD
jgi:hypothetical protein